MAEPTQLQQARYFVDAARTQRMGDRVLLAEERIAWLADALDRFLRFVEQREADMSGPAQVPGAIGDTPASLEDQSGNGKHLRRVQVPDEPPCKVCGHPADSAPHRWGSDDWAKHDFDPEPQPVCRACSEQKVISTFELRCRRCGRPDWDAATGSGVAQPGTVFVSKIVLRPGQTVSLPADARHPARHVTNCAQNAVIYLDVSEWTARAEPAETSSTTPSACFPESARPETADELLLQLCDRATPGPWRFDDAAVEIVNEHGDIVCAFPDVAADVTRDDAAFIAVARNELPKLIARVRELDSIAGHLLRAPMCPKCGRRWFGPLSGALRKCVDDLSGPGCQHVWERDAKEHSHAR